MQILINLMRALIRIFFLIQFEEMLETLQYNRFVTLNYFRNITNLNLGVSGAGRSPKEAFLYTEVAEGLNPYGITRHRHMPEIEQVLSDA